MSIAYRAVIWVEKKWQLLVDFINESSNVCFAVGFLLVMGKTEPAVAVLLDGTRELHEALW